MRFVLAFILSLFVSTAWAETDFPAQSGNWTVAATWTNGTVPTATTDVLLNNTYDVQCNTTNCVAKSIDMTGGSGFFNRSTGSRLTLTPSNITLSAGKFISTGTAEILINGTGNGTLTTSGNFLGNITLNMTPTSTITLGDNFSQKSSIDWFRVKQGGFNTNNQTLNLGAFFFNEVPTRSINLTNSTMNLNGTASYVYYDVAGGLTFDAGTSRIYVFGTADFVTYGITLYEVCFNGTDTNAYLQGWLRCTNFSRIGTAVKTDNFNSNDNLTVTGNLNITGNNASNRLLISTSVIGSPKNYNVTGATVTVANADFRDINFINTTMPVDLSAIAGGIGDCGGNTNITFTPSQAHYWFNDTGNWSNISKWVNATGVGCTYPPLPQDDVYFNASSFTGASKTVTADMPRLGKSIDWTGATNTPTLTLGNNVDIFGSLILISGMSLGGTKYIVFYGRSNYTLTTTGKQTWDVYLYNKNGGMTLGSNLNSVGYSVVHNFGTFDLENYTVVASAMDNDNLNARTLDLDNGTWNTSYSYSAGWDVTPPTGLTIIPGNSEIILNYATNADYQNFDGQNLTYNNITLNPGSGYTGYKMINSNNNFNAIIIKAPCHVKFGSNSTTNFTTFLANGTAGNYILLNNTAGTFAANFTKLAGGSITAHYTNISNINITGGETGDATDNCANVTGANVGWNFAAVAAAVRRIFFIE